MATSTPNTGALNLRINAGEDFARLLVWKAGDPLTPVDLSGCEATMQVRRAASAPAALLTLTSSPAAGLRFAGPGELWIELTAAQTAALTWRTGVYDLEITFPSGNVRRLLSGVVTVSPEVTRG